MADILAQTVTVYNKSGKAVSTSKNLVNIFKEAKSAYREKKADIKASKDPEIVKRKPKEKLEPRHSHHSPGSRRHSRRPSAESLNHERRRHRPRSHERRSHGRDHRSDSLDAPPRSRRTRTDIPPVQRGYTDSFFTNDRASTRRAYPWEQAASMPPSPLRHEHDQMTTSTGMELSRRHSFSDTTTLRADRRHSMADSEIDMDLAYGELPPPLPSRRGYEKRELKEKANTLQRILEEANCLQSSASAIIKHLQENPEAMAAVGLTLAEISNLIGKLGPAALLSLKSAFPAVVALLLSSEFLIAAGVGVGVTVISIGGYKIVKRIRNKKAVAKETEEEEIEEDTEDLNRIEHWRRGVADFDTASIATSVEGEIITPGAAREIREREKARSKKTRKPSPEATSTLEKKAKEERKKKEQKQIKEDKKREAKEEKRAKEEKKKSEKEQQPKDNQLATLKAFFKRDKEQGSGPSTS